MELRILYIGDGPDRWFAQWLEQWKEPGTVIETCGFGSHVREVECAFKEHLAAATVIRHSVTAEKEGFDAIVIGCFYDPGLREARELVKIPVVGVCEASLHLAAMLAAGEFSVLVPGRKSIPKMSENARSYGLESRIASWRRLGLSVSEMADREKTRSAIEREARLAVEQDLAEVVCLGCTATAGLAEGAQEVLGVPIVDPVLAGLKVAEFRATLWKRFGISHSKVGGYEAPPAEQFAAVFDEVLGHAPSRRDAKSCRPFGKGVPASAGGGIGQLVRRIKH